MCKPGCNWPLIAGCLACSALDRSSESFFAVGVVVCVHQWPICVTGSYWKEIGRCGISPSWLLWWACRRVQPEQFQSAGTTGVNLESYLFKYLYREYGLWVQKPDEKKIFSQTLLEYFTVNGLAFRPAIIVTLYVFKRGGVTQTYTWYFWVRKGKPKVQYFES